MNQEELDAIERWCNNTPAVRVDALPMGSVSAQMRELVRCLWISQANAATQQKRADAAERQRDNLHAALIRIRDYSYLAGEGEPRAVAIRALEDLSEVQR